MKRSRRIPSLPTDREAAGYWNTHSLAEHIEDTREGTNRFVRWPKQAISIQLDPERQARGDSRGQLLLKKGMRWSKSAKRTS
ncbi:MAG: hypothetical protein WBH61_09165 [Candidatus Methylomirabilis sp.]